MTIREALSTLSNVEIAQMLCDMIDEYAGKNDVHTCRFCPVEKNCKRGRNGFLAWLEKEVDEEIKEVFEL